MVYNEYADRIGEVLNGIVQRADEKAVVVELGKYEAVMPAREKVPHERYRPRQRLKVYLVDASREQRGPQLVVSRAHPGLLKRLFELEVPEIFSGVVDEWRSRASRGTRSKVAVVARQENVKCGRLLHQHAGGPHPEHRQRVAGREEIERDRVVARAVPIRRQRPQPGARAERDAE